MPGAAIKVTRSGVIVYLPMGAKAEEVVEKLKGKGVVGEEESVYCG